MYVNDGVSDEVETDMSNEYSYFVDLAINKRDEFKRNMINSIKRIRPLVIIQFPDSSKRPY